MSYIYFNSIIKGDDRSLPHPKRRHQLGCGEVTWPWGGRTRMPRLLVSTLCGTLETTWTCRQACWMQIPVLGSGYPKEILSHVALVISKRSGYLSTGETVHVGRRGPVSGHSLGEKNTLSNSDTAFWEASWNLPHRLCSFVKVYFVQGLGRGQALMYSPYLTNMGKSPRVKEEEMKNDKSAETARWATSSLTRCSIGRAILHFWSPQIPQNSFVCQGW